MNYEEIAEKHLGFPGAMISWSKSGYIDKNRDNLPVFNSNIIAMVEGEAVKIWHGDIDVTKSAEKLKSLAEDMNCDILVLREQDARFENEKNPRIENFCYSVTPSGEKALGKFEKKYYDAETLLRNKK